MRNKTKIPGMSILWLVLTLGLITCSDPQIPTLSIVTDPNIEGPVAHGLQVLMSSLEKQMISYEKVRSVTRARGSMLLVAGLSQGTGSAAQLMSEANHPIPSVAEAFTIWKTEIRQKPAWIMNGFDERGLMYGLLDVAERVTWNRVGDDPLGRIEAITEQPDVGTRAVSIYTMNRAYWESRFYDEVYWERYMDMLAKNRFNELVVIFGYENGGFLAPCYPYYFDVEGFSGISMEDMTPAMQMKNLAALNRMIEMAHARGLDFKVGIWDHIYRGGVQTGGIPEEELMKQDRSYLVHGVTAENLNAYTKSALAKFIRLVPGLDGIQLRMHNESGLKRGEEMELFWTEVFTMIKTTAPELKIDLRAKELPESVIQIARDMELNFTITTKYWMEQMGLPFHPTHINRENQLDRRHGYADMLRYPREYKIHWRLWSGGTQRVLLWGDPGYVRRFAESTHLYDGVGFEVNEPLATKMEAQPHDAQPVSLLTPSYIYYRYEFERYWYFFQLFGRLAYNPDTPTVLWDREFEKRFGKEAGPFIQEALNKASWILPRIVAACSPYSKFPTTRGWPAKQRYGDLPEYASAEGSDIEQFASFDEEAQLLIEGVEMTKRLPSATSLWFDQTYRQIDSLLNKASAVMGDTQNKEFISTVTDLRILSYLAQYHSRRIPAAVSYRIFERTGDPHALDDAIAYEVNAIESWRNIVASAGDVYAPDLMMGVREAGHGGMIHRLAGHWKDELQYLEEGLGLLNAQRNALAGIEKERTAPVYIADRGVPYTELFQIQHQDIVSSPRNQDIAISATVKAPAGVKWVKLRYRAVNQYLDYQTLTMKADPESDIYSATIPAAQIDTQFDLMYFIELMDCDGNGRNYPDFEVETPYVVVELERSE
jgi:hypothetical protein